MKRFAIIFISFCILGFEGCDNENEEPVPELPFITASSLELIDGSNHSGKADTLRLTFDLSDGEFDFGLDYGQYAPPYHALNFFVSNTTNQTLSPIPAEVVQHSTTLSFLFLQPSATQSGTIVTFEKQKKLNPTQEYTCGKFTDRYQRVGLKMSDNAFIYNKRSIADTVPSSLGQILILSDSFSIERNRNFTNLIVEYFVEQPDGSFQLFDWEKIICQYNFNGRVPEVLGLNGRTGPFKVKTLSSRKIRISYNMASLGFRTLFGEKRIKLRFFAIDRSLNESNVVETDPILIPKR